MPIYDSHPVYPHQEEMPYSKEPLKTLYVWQRLLSTVFLVPFWVLYYAVLPRRFRPRPSWSLRQIILVKFYRRVYRVVEVAGVTWGTRDPCEECDNSKLKETRFEWIPPLADEFRTGVVDDNEVEFKRVGTFIWPRVPPPHRRATAGLEPAKSADVDLESSAGPEVIGLFLHGGGYTQMSAHEKAGTSRIPRRLIKDKVFSEIYAVEYRLLQHAPAPAAIQDAAAVYAHIVINLLGATSNEYGVYTYPTTSTVSPGSFSLSTDHENLPYVHEINTPKPADFAGSPRRVRNAKVVLIGDSAGGNLVLGLARWLRDEGSLPAPDGLLLLSPSCDPSHAFPLTPSSYIPRPHANTDYLVDTPEPRALLQRTFLGHHPLETIHSPYLSPASPRVLRAYGHRVDPRARGDHIGLGAIALAAESAVAIAGASAVVLANSAAAVARAEGHPLMAVTNGGVKESTTSDGNASPSSSPAITPYTTPQIPSAPAPRGFPAGARAADGDSASIVSSAGAPTPFITPRVPGVVPAKGVFRDGERQHGAGTLGRSGTRPMLMSTMTFLNPRPREPVFRHKLFGGFPRSFVTVGDAERLELEIKSLVDAMKTDGVDLHVEWAKDGVHDMLMLPAWDEKVREQVWHAIKTWIESL